MSRTLTFELIQDTRFSKSPKSDVSKWAKKIEKKLKKFGNISISFNKTRRIVFPDNTISYRKKAYIKKDGKKVTWNDIYGIVNSVKACPYRFI